MNKESKILIAGATGLIGSAHKRKFEKEGYETSYIVSANPSPRFNNMSFNPAPEIAPIELQPNGSIPHGMVYVSPGKHISVTSGGVSEINIRPFYID